MVGMAAHAERLDLEMLSANLSQPEALQCCCGKTDCVFLKHNCSVLDSVEKDVHTAARLGQVRESAAVSLSEIVRRTTTSVCPSSLLLAKLQSYTRDSLREAPAEEQSWSRV